MSEKIFYTMGEVAEMFDVNASLIRYWGTQFPSLKPQRNKKGNRLFTPEDIETLKRIYHYVKERGMTLEGAKKALRGDRSAKPEVNSDVELLERLQTLRSMLVAVRDSLGAAEPGQSIVAEVVVPESEVVVEPEVEVVDEPKAEEIKPEEPQRPIYREQTLFDL